MVDWNEIVATHGPLVWRTAYRLLGRHDDALDCCQETFLAAYRATSRVRVDDWPAFLVSLATRRAIDLLRRRVRVRRRLAPLDEVPEPTAPGPCPDGPAQEAERLEQVRLLLARLPAKQAEVFWLSCIEDLKHAAIASQMGISDGEVRVLLHRARVRLQAAFTTVSPELRTDR
jgi:RNA polymerase sigma-70 factor (ECF subfamily)